MTLEEEYEKAKNFHIEKYGNLENCWQWHDEGIPNLIGDYLSSMGEFSEDDWTFARKVGIEDECRWWLEQHNDNCN